MKDEVKLFLIELERLAKEYERCTDSCLKIQIHADMELLKKAVSLQKSRSH